MNLYAGSCMAEPCTRGLSQHQAGQKTMSCWSSPYWRFIGHGYFNICTVCPFFYFSLNVTSIFLWVINVDLGWVGELLFFFFFFSLQPTHYNISGVKEQSETIGQLCAVLH